MSLLKHPFAPRGYIHHRRGFAVTSFNSRDIAYILNLTGPSDSFRLVIETMVSDNNAPFKEASIIRPVIPYRINLGDREMLNILNSGNGFALQRVGTDPIFNPGMTLTDNKLNSPAFFGLLTSQGNIQINVTRDQFALLNKSTSPKVWKVVNSSTTVGPMTFTNPGGLISNFVYKAKDTRASIIVSNNGNTDYLYVSVTATVNMAGKENKVAFYDSPETRTRLVNTGASRSYTYSLPVLLKLEIDRTNINVYGSIMLKPTAWRYLFPLTTDRPISGSSADFTAQSWNCDIIPRCKFSIVTNYNIPRSVSWTANETYYSPVGVGCMWDVALNEDATPSGLISISAIGEFNKDTGAKTQNVNWQLFYLSNMSDMFRANDAGGELFPVTSDTHVSRIYGDVNQGNTLFAISLNDIKEDTESSSVRLYYFDTSYVSKTMVISDVYSACLCKSGNSFVIGCDRVSTTEPGISLFKCPSSTTIQVWNNSTRTISSLPSLGFTFLGHTHLTPTYSKGVLNVLAPTSVKLYYNSTGEDKSIEEPSLLFRARFIRELYNSTIELVTIRANAVRNYLYFYYRTDGGGKIDWITQPVGFASYGDSGGSETDFFRLYCKDNLLKIQRFDTQVVNINGTPSIGYWANPTFNITAQGGGGIFVTLILDDCSGIFRKETGGWIKDWDTAVGGVPVDPIYTRPDIQYNYGGSYNDFVSSGGSGHYWATIKYPTWNLKMTYNGKSLIDHNGSCSFVNYTTSGKMSIHTHTYLNPTVLDAMGRPYTDPDYELLDVAYKLSINTSDLILAEGTVDIDPPNPTASITTTVNYKTISGNIDFDVSRDSKTSIKNIVLYKNNIPQGIAFKSYPLTGVTSDNIDVSTANMVKGDYVFFKYKSLYLDSRGSEQESRRITYVAGHKYHLENVQIWIDGNDKTDEIAATSTGWLYINTTGTITVGIKVDIKHENFPNEAYPSSLSNVYPAISGTYMMVIPVSYPPRSKTFFVQGVSKTTRYEEIPPVGSPTTYPNCGYAMANKLYQRWNNTSTGFKDNNSYTTEIELTNETLTATGINADGQYHIYLIVEDEFAQKSAWCITNIAGNYRIPFRGN